MSALTSKREFSLLNRKPDGSPLEGKYVVPYGYAFNRHRCPLRAAKSNLPKPNPVDTVLPGSESSYYPDHAEAPRSTSGSRPVIAGKPSRISCSRWLPTVVSSAMLTVPRTTCFRVRVALDSWDWSSPLD